ncbi:MAG: hypothetical protein ACP5MG_01405 [Verrucomicrobiia bacterium]
MAKYLNNIGIINKSKTLFNAPLFEPKIQDLKNIRDGDRCKPA